jgi:hypothetical protein
MNHSLVLAFALPFAPAIAGAQTQAQTDSSHVVPQSRDKYFDRGYASRADAYAAEDRIEIAKEIAARLALQAKMWPDSSANTGHVSRAIAAKADSASMTDRCFLQLKVELDTQGRDGISRTEKDEAIRTAEQSAEECAAHLFNELRNAQH